MPTLGAALNFSQLEARNVTVHNLSAAPSAPVKGQMYYDTVSNTLMWFDGTQWQSAKGGVTAPPDASATTKGIVQLAGDLTGTAAAPLVANGVITSAKIADATIVDTDVAAANKDGVAGTPSLRTLVIGGAQQAMPGNAPLSSIANANPNPGDVQFNNHKLILVADPSAAQDVATKNYVDNVAAGLSAKQSVRAASTGASLALSGSPVNVDGVAVATGNRVLAKDQTSPANNGIYVVAAGAWTRAPDFDAWSEIPGAFCWVEEGTVNADTGWVCLSDLGGTLGTTNITWSQFSGSAVITTGAGLQKTGNVISVVGDGNTIDTNGSFSSVEVKPGGITGLQLANGAVDLTTKVQNILPIGNGGTGGSTAVLSRTALGAAGYYNNNATHGAGTTITIPQATHGLRATRGIHVQAQDNTSGNVELPDISVAANGDVTVTYSAAVAANSKLISLVG